MPSKFVRAGESRHSVQSGSFINSARRAQIVEHAIEVLAELGYARASLARISQHAGISRTLITYHFADKDELIQEVIAKVYDAGEAAVRPGMDAEPTAGGQLGAFIKDSLRFYRDYRIPMLALMQINIGARTEAGAVRGDLPEHTAELDALEQLLTAGQVTGEFCAFDVRVMVMTVRNTLDGILHRFAGDPGLDLENIATELVALFSRATASPLSTQKSNMYKEQ